MYILSAEDKKQFACNCEETSRQRIL